MKRMFDIVISAIALILLSPLLACVALLVRWRLGRPVLFSQRRIGLNERSFHLYKFRSMRDAVDHLGQPLSDAVRLTPFGRLLRATSLDELPALWNVLRGEMSLVGPRPLLPEYLPLYTPFQRRRHETLPGITGWAQVNGRNALSWEKKFEHDVWYVDHRSLLLDLKILAMTVFKVIRRDGISAAGDATMPRFTGEPGGGGVDRDAR